MHGDGPATVRTVTEAGRDIETREDCEQLVRAFYARALGDPVIGFIFTDVARLDLEAHVPVIASFWATILLGARSYGGGVFAAHAALDAKVRLRPGHFARWLALWRESVDAQFCGPRAEEAKAHAERVARAFEDRLRGRVTGEVSLPAGVGLPVTLHGPGGER